MQVFCSECGTQETLSPGRWRCDCGGAWETAERTDFDLALVDTSDFTIWRYRRLFGLDFETPAARLGVGWTPLLPMAFEDHEVLLKLEYMTPTASFKDRGTAAMMNILAHQGATHVVDDSSGNAGASVAAYAARAGMQAEIFVPANASPAKQAQIAIYGAKVRPIPGPRINAKHAAREAAAHGAVYAPHAYHPGFLIGQQSAAWEVWEQLGRRVPDRIVVPLGQGGNVQPAKLAPLYHALEAGLDTVPAVEPTTPSVAEGLAISQPVRGRRLLEAIRETGGTCVTVEDDAILQAQRQLARRGLYIEPTSATVIAALEIVLQATAPDETVIVSLTGSGLKGSPRL